jgi:hypothetical protein
MARLCLQSALMRVKRAKKTNGNWLVFLNMVVHFATEQERAISSR